MPASDPIPQSTERDITDVMLDIRDDDATPKHIADTLDDAIILIEALREALGQIARLPDTPSDCLHTATNLAGEALSRSFASRSAT